MKSPFDVFIAWTSGAVIAIDVFCAVLIVANDCAALLGMLLWTLAAALFVVLVLLPALVRRLLAPVGARALRFVLVAAVATAIPAGLFQLQKYPRIGHCIG